MIKINVLAINIKNNDGTAAASKRSWDAKIYAVVANVSKLNGLNIKVIGNSFITSIVINIPIRNTEFFK